MDHNENLDEVWAEAFAKRPGGRIAVLNRSLRGTATLAQQQARLLSLSEDQAVIAVTPKWLLTLSLRQSALAAVLTEAAGRPLTVQLEEAS